MRTGSLFATCGSPSVKNCCTGGLREGREERIFGSCGLGRPIRRQVDGEGERGRLEIENLKIAFLKGIFNGFARLSRFVALEGGSSAFGKVWGPKRDRIANHSPLAFWLNLTSQNCCFSAFYGVWVFERDRNANLLLHNVGANNQVLPLRFGYRPVTLKYDYDRCWNQDT